MRRYCLVLALVSACVPHQHVDRSAGLGSATTGRPLSEVPIKGHHVVVVFGDGCRVEGELLAQDWQSLWLVGEEGAPSRVPTAQVVRVFVELYQSGSLASGIVTGLGTASTVTHGMFLVLTGPAWLAAGISSTVYESERNDLDAQGSELDALWRFARYPQGPPPALAATRLTAATCAD